MYDDIENRVTEMVGKYAKQNGITRDTHLMDDLGLDALDIVEVIMAAETEFDIHISEDAADCVRTVGDVVDAVIKSKKEAWA